MKRFCSHYLIISTGSFPSLLITITIIRDWLVNKLLQKKKLFVKCTSKYSDSIDVHSTKCVYGTKLNQLLFFTYLLLRK